MEKKLLRFLPLLAFCQVGVVLLWEHWHIGIPSHHLFANPELPSFSNLWGIVLLPVICFIAVKFNLESTQSFLAKFFGAVFYGLAIGLCFTFDLGQITKILFFGILGIGLLIPVYKGAYVSGFVWAMSFFFGAVLPSLFALLFAGISFVLYNLLKWILLKFGNPKT